MAEDKVTSPLVMDRSEPLGNSLDETGRRALHVLNQGGTLQVKGLSVAGRITAQTVDGLTWAAVPAVALVKRNSLLVQNLSKKAIVLWNYSPTAPATEGFQIAPGGFKEVAVTDAIVVYCRCLDPVDTAALIIEELS